MLLNLDQLEKHLAKEEFQELESFNAFRHMESLKESILERAKHKREYDKRVNDRTMQSKEGKFDSSKALNASLVVIECSGTESDKQDTSIKSGNDITHVMDPDIRQNDQVPFAEVDRNATSDSTNMCHRGREIDQNAEKYQVSCPLLDPSFDNMTTKFSNQSLESENISLKKTVAQLQKMFQNGNTNKAKFKKEIEVLETINIELEHSVAKLLAENEKLHKENEHLKRTYKDLYDSIKKN
ncbi:hypothetical protein Tco_1291418 [Tanacetum coccineum]